MTISIIVATSQNNVIGKDNKMPWHLPADLKHFKKLTMGHHIIMGRKTFESIGKPLPGRTNIVVTRNQKLNIKGVVMAYSLKEAIEIAKSNNETEAFIIGGERVYKQALRGIDGGQYTINKLYITKIFKECEGDTYFPKLEEKWKDTTSSERLKHTTRSGELLVYQFCEYVKR